MILEIIINRFNYIKLNLDFMPFIAIFDTVETSVKNNKI